MNLLSLVMISSSSIQSVLPGCLQGNTILAMDFMEMGTLWENLLRKNRSGQHAFQFYQR